MFGFKTALSRDPQGRPLIVLDRLPPLGTKLTSSECRAWGLELLEVAAKAEQEDGVAANLAGPEKVEQAIACGDCSSWCRCSAAEHKGTYTDPAGDDTPLQCVICGWHGLAADLIPGAEGEGRCPVCNSLAGIVAS
jgi:hypothetical protein